MTNKKYFGVLWIHESHNTPKLFRSDRPLSPNQCEVTCKLFSDFLYINYIPVVC